FVLVTAQARRANETKDSLVIMRAEDERRYDDDLREMLASDDANIRRRAALAMGRIGDASAVTPLVESLKTEIDQDVRQMTGFAIGEIESPEPIDALIVILNNAKEQAPGRARAIEALGKIGAVLLSNQPTPPTGQRAPDDQRLVKIRTAILNALKVEADRRLMSDRLTVLLGLTAVVRTRPADPAGVILRFLEFT